MEKSIAEELLWLISDIDMLCTEAYKAHPLCREQYILRIKDITNLVSKNYDLVDGQVIKNK